MKIHSKKKSLALVFAAAALATGVGLVVAPRALQAQDSPAEHSRGDGDCHGRRGEGPRAERTPAERLAHWQQMLGRVSERLQLDARQVAAAQRILTDTLARAEQLRANTAERTPERHAGRRAMMEAADARFTQLLTAPQRTAWAALKAEFFARRGHGAGHRGGPGHEGGRGHDGDDDDAPRGSRAEVDRGI
jgi:Spy/CpxP family protein refolding chaperone